MPDRTKLLVHVNRISTLFGGAILHGPDGTLEGKFAPEHPKFTHHLVSFYLAGCLAYLESEDGTYSWNSASQQHVDFDTFAASAPPKQCYLARGISKANLNALVEIRNAVVHNNGDLSKNTSNKKKGSNHALASVTTAKFPGVVLNGSSVTLEGDFMEYVRVSTYAVRDYFGEQ